MDRHTWVAPFVEAVVVTLREWAEVDAAPLEMGASDGVGDLSAVIRLTAGGEGYLVLSFPIETATALAVRVLDGAATVDDEMIRDCAGELANVAAGQAKTLLVGTPDHFTFSTPVVMDRPPSGPPEAWQVVVFESDIGTFQLRVLRPV